MKDWDKFSKCLDAGKGKNIIYSDEVIGNFFGNDQAYFDNLKALTKSWRVKLVFSYRRLFEWLPVSFVVTVSMLSGLK